MIGLTHTPNVGEEKVTGRFKTERANRLYCLYEQVTPDVIFHEGAIEIYGGLSKIYSLVRQVKKERGSESNTRFKNV